MYQGSSYGGRDGDGDGPGYPFNNNSSDHKYESSSASGKKRGRSSLKDGGDGTNSPSCGHNNMLNSPSEDTTAAETSVGSDSMISGVTNPSNLHTTTPAHRHRHNNGLAAAAVVIQPTTAVDNDAVIVAVGGTTTQLSNNNNNNTTSPVNNDSNAAQQLASVEEHRRRLIRQLRHVGIATGSSFVVAILSVVPVSFLVAFMVCMMALVGLLYKVYHFCLFELNLIMQGRGIGDYLPASIYEQLTQTSLHEYMSDRTTINENAYLMLYMIPGLSRDQIDAYVGRLAPRHQSTLHRRGLGNFLGTSFMRLIVGDERLSVRHQPQIDSNVSVVSSATSVDGDDSDVASNSSPVVPRRLVLPPTIPEEVVDDTSDLGEEEDPTMNVVPVTSIQVQHSPPTQLPPQEAPETQESIRAETEVEEQVIYDAIGSAITTYMGVAADMVQTSARRSAGLFSGTIFRASMTATMFGVGVSIYGFWNGTYNPQTFFRPTMQMLSLQMSSVFRPAWSLRPQMPSSNVLVTSTLLSGATAGIMLLFQIANVTEPTKERNEEDDDDQTCDIYDAKTGNMPDGSKKK